MTDVTPLRFWVLPHYGLRTLPVLKRHLSGLRAGHRDLQVDVSVHSVDSLWSCLARILKCREGELEEIERPDIIEIPSHWTASLAQMGLLEELSGDGVELEGYFEFLRGHCVTTSNDGNGAGRVFSLPWWMEIRVVYYRQDILRARGLDPEEALSTWEGLSRCRRLLRDGARKGRPFVCVANPNPRQSVALSDVAQAIWSHGGDFLSSEGTRCLLYREEAIGGARAYFRLFDDGCISLAAPRAGAADSMFHPDAAVQFSGRLPRDVSPELRRSLRAVAHLSGTVGASSLLTSSHLALVRGSKAPEASRTFLLQLAQTDACRRYAASIGAFAPTAEWEAALEDFPELGPAFRRAAARGRGLANVAFMATLERVFERSMSRVVQALLERRYNDELLRQELFFAAAEMDSVLSSHG